MDHIGHDIPRLQSYFSFNVPRVFAFVDSGFSSLVLRLTLVFHSCMYYFGKGIIHFSL